MIKDLSVAMPQAKPADGKSLPPNPPAVRASVHASGQSAITQLDFASSAAAKVRLRGCVPVSLKALCVLR